MSTQPNIANAAFDHKTCEPDIEKAAFDQKTYDEEKVCSEPQNCKERKSLEHHIRHDHQPIEDQQNIFEAQQAFDNLYRDPDPPIIATPAEPSYLRTTKNYVTARMYIPTHYFLFVILLLFIESAALFAYTTIGLLKSFPQPVPLSREGCHCSPPNTFGETEFRPAMQPLVINVAPNIAVAAPLPDVAVPTISLPNQPAETPGVFPSLAGSTIAPSTTSPLSSSATATDSPQATLSGLISELISSLVARESSSSTTTTPQLSASRSAVTQLVLTTTTLPPSSTPPASVVTLTSIVASGSPEPSVS